MPTTRICLVERCGKLMAKRGLCRPHFRRFEAGEDLPTLDFGYGAGLRWIREHAGYQNDDCLMWPFPHVDYAYPHMRYNGRDTTVARVMCEEVNGPPPSRKHDSAHSCGRGKQGCVNPNHLRWDTRAGNHADKIEHGTSIRGPRNHRTKLTEGDVRYIRAMQGKVRGSDLARQFGLTQTGILHVQNRNSWAWLE